MNAEERQSAARLIWQSIRALEDGSVSPSEGRYLALAGHELLQKFAHRADGAMGKMCLEAAAVICRNLARKLKDLEP